MTETKVSKSQDNSVKGYFKVGIPKQYLYRFEIKKGNPSGYGYEGTKHKYSLNYTKLCGNHYGGCGTRDTREEVIQVVNEMKNAWEKRDSILSRTSDKLSVKNVYFTSEFEEFTIKSLLDKTPQLSEWF